MSLLDLAKEIKQNFDPSKDKVGQSQVQRIPAGEYEIVIKDAGFYLSDRSGWEQVVVDCEILHGDFAKRVERVTFSFIEEWNGKPIPKFVLERSMKYAQKLAFIADYRWKNADFEDTRTVAEALKNVIGTEMLLTIIETENKKDPSNPYRSYEFEPNITSESAFELTEDDVPF